MQNNNASQQTNVKYSPLTKGFYVPEISYPKLPNDCIEISKEKYLQLINRPEGSTIEFINDDLIIVLPPEKTDIEKLLEHKQLALSKTDSFHANIVQQLVGNPTQVEKDTWSVKLQTAQAVLAEETLSAFSQSFLLSAGYNTLDKQKTWAQSVINKATNYTLVIGLAEKIRDFTKEGIKVATTIEQIDLVLNQAKEKADEAVKAILVRA